MRLTKKMASPITNHKTLYSSDNFKLDLLHALFIKLEVLELIKSPGLEVPKAILAYKSASKFAMRQFIAT